MERGKRKKIRRPERTRQRMTVMRIFTVIRCGRRRLSVRGIRAMYSPPLAEESESNKKMVAFPTES